MFTRPEGLHDEDVVRGLGAGWDLVGAQVEYAPLGFGSYHWRVRRGGHRWFATADDLAARRWDAAEPLPLVARRLTSALAGSRRLRDAGLEFVVAPLPQPSGELVRALGDRYVLALYPFVDGVTPQDGAYPDRTARAAVVARLAALHAVALPAVDPGDGSGVLADDFVLPHLAGLRTAMADPGGPWDGGPFAEPTRDLLARHAAPLAHALERYRRLVASVVARGTGFVLTHGEPHPGNTIGTPAGLVLIDWDTLLLAPPERDLWGLVEEDPDVLELYRSLTGRQADAEALRLYRLRWDLTEICLYVDQFRHAHRLSDDTAEAWAGLQHHLDPAAQPVTPLPPRPPARTRSRTTGRVGRRESATPWRRWWRVSRTCPAENRRFLRRAVTFMAQEHGIDQFLDIGTGIPAPGNTHEVSQAINPASRVVYVDNDPVVRWPASRSRHATRQRNWRPPSTTMVWPVTNRLSGPARNATAPTTSSGTPARLIAPRSTPYCSASAITLRLASVRTNPGATVLTVMSRRPSSLAMTRVIATRAPFDVT